MARDHGSPPQPAAELLDLEVSTRVDPCFTAAAAPDNIARRMMVVTARGLPATAARTELG